MVDCSFLTKSNITCFDPPLAVVSKWSWHINWNGSTSLMQSYRRNIIQTISNIPTGKHYYPRDQKDMCHMQWHGSTELLVYTHLVVLWCLTKDSACDIAGPACSFSITLEKSLCTTTLFFHYWATYLQLRNRLRMNSCAMLVQQNKTHT